MSVNFRAKAGDLENLHITWDGMWTGWTLHMSGLNSPHLVKPDGEIYCYNCTKGVATQVIGIRVKGGLLVPQVRSPEDQAELDQLRADCGYKEPPKELVKGSGRNTLDELYQWFELNTMRPKEALIVLVADELDSDIETAKSFIKKLQDFNLMTAESEVTTPSP